MKDESIFPQSDDRLFSYFLAEIVSMLTGIRPKGTPPPKDEDGLKEVFILSGLILIVCTEPLKLLLRRNIGKLSLAMPRVLVAAILYFCWSALLYYFSNEPSYSKISQGLIAGASFYTLFGIIILVLGLSEYSKANKSYIENPEMLSKHLHRGDSVLFGYLLAKGWDNKKIWLYLEPSLLFIFGLISTVLPALIDPILALVGLPLLLTSISFWFNEWFQITNVWNVQSKKINKEAMKNWQKPNFGGDKPTSSRPR